MRLSQLLTDAVACRAARAIQTPLLAGVLTLSGIGANHQQNLVTLLP